MKTGHQERPYLNIPGPRGIKRVCTPSDYDAFTVDDVSTADLTPNQAEGLAGLQVKAGVAIPIPAGKRRWGLLVVHHCQAPCDWQTEDIDATSVASAPVPEHGCCCCFKPSNFQGCGSIGV